MDRMREPTFWDRLFHLDAHLSRRLEIRARLLRWLAIVLAHTGDAAVWLAGAFAALYLGGSEFWKELGTRVLAAMTAGGIASTALKWTFRRTRPPGPPAGLYFSLDRHALPSGHATRVACITMALSPILPGWGSVLMAFWAALVSLSRVALQVHYLLDILVGITLGGVIGLLVRGIL